MIKIGIPITGYSTAKQWLPFFRNLIGTHSDVIDLNVDFGRTNLPTDIDIILFDGGADVHPALYGGKYHESIGVDLQRDWEEMIIFNFYKTLGTVFAGICRGSQFLNVACGGTLYEDLPSANLGHNSSHNVMVTQSETLFNCLGIKEGEEITVNSLHHQAVKDLGHGLTPVMLDSDFGIIEGFQSLDGKIRAVQSHPEMNTLGYDKRIEVCDWLFRVKEF